MAGKLVNIAVGIASFAQFDFACERGYAFSEAYLAKPASELLRASYPDCTVLTEHRHPVLKRIGKGGQPRVDVSVLGKPAAGRPRWEGKLRACLELKWCGDTLPRIDDVLWDLVRLTIVAASKPDVECYFALVGIRSRLDTFVDSLAGTRIIKRNPRSPRAATAAAGSFLRTKEEGDFGAMKFKQLSAALQKDMKGRLTDYQSSALPREVIGFQQLQTIRHDAGPLEDRPGMKVRIGLSAIASRITAQRSG